MRHDQNESCVDQNGSRPSGKALTTQNVDSEVHHGFSAVKLAEILQPNLDEQTVRLSSRISDTARKAVAIKINAVISLAVCDSVYAPALLVKFAIDLRWHSTQPLSR